MRPPPKNERSSLALVLGAMLAGGSVMGSAAAAQGEGGFALGGIEVQGMACAPGPDGVSVKYDVTRRNYVVAGNSVVLATYYLTETEKPISSNNGDTLAYFDYDWGLQFANAPGPEKRLAEVCLHTSYRVLTPSFSDRAVAKCFRRFTEKIVAHEDGHLAVTQKEIERTARSLIGLPYDEAVAVLQGMEARIAQVNRDYHATPTGQQVLPSDMPDRRCTRDR